MPLYIKVEDVEIRLLGKVRFTDDENDENRFQRRLLKRLIDEAEGQVEHDLSPRYAAPLSRVDNAPFAMLPDHPTKNILRTLCELLSVVRVLETDFGRGSIVNGDEYADKQLKRYNEILDKLLEKWPDSQGWKHPPLTALQLNYMNQEADHGFAGEVLTTNTDPTGHGGFPPARINDPSESFFGGSPDPQDVGRRRG